MRFKRIKCTKNGKQIINTKMLQINTYVNNRDGKVNIIVKHGKLRVMVATPLKSDIKFTGAEVPQTVPGWKAKSTMMRRWYNGIEEYLAHNTVTDAESLKTALKAIISGTDPDKVSTGKTLVEVLRSGISPISVASVG